MRIKKNDIVKMLAGKDLGKTGKVLRSLPDRGKVIVEGLNLIKKHTKTRKEGQKGQRVELPRGIDASNVMLVCPKCGEGTKIAYKIAGGVKSRVCKKCQGEI